jgi:8-amino-7-oxononanoate synthase
VFSTGAVPATAAAVDAALDVIDREPERRARLLELAAFLRSEIGERGITLEPGDSQIIPVIIGDNNRAQEVAARLNREGFDVRAIRPPTVPPGTARLRVSVNAMLGKEALVGFASALASAIGASRRPACGVGSRRQSEQRRREIGN